jgi:hypothetical protein
MYYVLVRYDCTPILNFIYDNFNHSNWKLSLSYAKCQFLSTFFVIFFLILTEVFNFVLLKVHLSTPDDGFIKPKHVV